MLIKWLEQIKFLPITDIYLGITVCQYETYEETRQGLKFCSGLFNRPELIPEIKMGLK